MGAELNSKADPIFVAISKIKSYMYSFTCENCGAVYTMAEQAHRSGKKKTKNEEAA